MRKLNYLSGILTLSVLLAACANAQVWDKGLREVQKDQMFQSLSSSSVVLIGENHGFRTHRDQHMEILNELRKRGLSIHVGFEFFYYPDQNLVDQFRLQQITEDDFLKQITWGSPSFDYYRDQALFPQLSLGEKTWALNAPRALTRQISRGGLGSLTPELSALVPPDFALGREAYKERFIEAIGGHSAGPEFIERYFAAQSMWDDTMAWNIQKIKQQHPQQILVVIVGEFHTQYGGGLQDRLQARGVQNVVSVSQVNTQGLTESQKAQAIMPHPEYGPRADWIWAAPAVE